MGFLIAVIPLRVHFFAFKVVFTALRVNVTNGNALGNALDYLPTFRGNMYDSPIGQTAIGKYEFQSGFICTVDV